MTDDLLRLALATTAGLAAWLIPRRVAGAGMSSPLAIVLDMVPVLLAGALLVLLTGKPIFAALVVLSLGGGFALADRAKRETLREPVVFSDMSEFRHVFTHPHLYLPFAGPVVVIGGAVAAVVAATGVLVIGPARWQPEPIWALFALAVVCAAGWALLREPALGFAAAAMRRFHPTGDPVADAARLGPFAMLLIYGIIARAERDQRRSRYRPLPAPALKSGGAALPVVLVQCESFFDARRMSPRVPGDLLPGFDACLRHGATFGRLDVSAWGANTMRSEFAVLTGIPDERLGYDRFNPYHAFARAPLASLVSQLRGEGYNTLCLHPFDRSFFRRDLAMPALGFETFLGNESIEGSRRPPYRSDPDLARQVLEVLDEEGPRTFIFVITMGNHGPWPEAGPEIDPSLYRRFDTADVPQGGPLLRYLDGLARSDEMLQILLDGLGPHRREAILGFYGDHLPSLPQAFDHFAFDDWASDYVLVDGLAPAPRRLDLPAHMLPGVILERLRQRGAIGRDQAAVLGAA